MSAGSAPTGPAGVKNLRAMFEHKHSDQSTSPPSRGRSSPDGSTSSANSRQVSKVRSSFVAVERPGEAGQPAQWGLRKTSDVSSMAEAREAAVMEDSNSSVTPVMTNGQHTASSEPDLGAILKGSPFETSSTEQLQVFTKLQAQKSAEQKPAEIPKLYGSTTKGQPTDSKTQTMDQPASPSKPGTTKEAKSVKVTPSSINTKVASSSSKNSPTLSKKSPTMQKKSQASPTTTNGSGPAIKPRGGVSKIQGVMASASKANEERAKAEKAKLGSPKEEKKSQATPVTTNGNGAACRPRSGVSKIQGVMASASQAKDERAKAEKLKSESPKEEKKPSSTNTKPPSVASKPTAASKAHAQKQDSKPEATVKSPTSSRPTKLPSAATATTAAASARKGVPVETEESRSQKPDRRSINPQAPRVANVTTKASVARKSSRASIANGGEDLAKSRQSITHKPADESFLKRMTRPTASTAQKTHEKVQVNSPPRSSNRRVSENFKQSAGRKSLSFGAKDTNGTKAVTGDEDADQTQLEPVSEAPHTRQTEDGGEPGPAEKIDESAVPSQQIEVVNGV